MLCLPGATAFFAAAAVARLGVAMTSLAVLWTVRGATGSFTAAGAATALFAIAEATVGPQLARMVDERGQRRILPWSVGVFVLATSALVAGALLHISLALLAVLATVAGGSIPQVGALSAARWRHATNAPDQFAAALSLEAALNDVTFLCGPILVSTLSTVVYPAAGLTLAGCLIIVGMTAFIWQRHSEPPSHGPSERRLVDRRLLTPAVVTLFGINMSMGFFFGAIPVTIMAFAFAHHTAVLAGPISAVSSVTSLLAGLVYGVRAHRFQPMAVILTVSSFLILGTAALSAVPNIVVMFLGYAVVGAAIAPILIPAAVLLQQTTDPRVYTQAMTWMNSASAAGIAVAAPLAGLAIQIGDWRIGFLVTAGLTAALPVGTALARRRSFLVPAGVDVSAGVAD
ncbi:MAG TPA: MFS transporter [Mycobacteriales bacterium]|nr:MFS transporter [Mycobacteriales bacterium]